MRSVVRASLPRGRESKDRAFDPAELPTWQILERTNELAGDPVGAVGVAACQKRRSEVRWETASPPNCAGFRAQAR